MRIIGGTAKGRRLRIGKTPEIRPTSDYLKEVVFDILQKHINDVRFLDLFAGSGNVGIEALSRGASEVIFVDRSPRSIGIIESNLQTLGLSDRATLMRIDAWTAIKRMGSRHEKFSVIFVDPPYRQGILLSTLIALSASNLLEDDGVIIVEHFHKEELPKEVPGLTRDREIRHGESKLSFFLKEKP